MHLSLKDALPLLEELWCGEKLPQEKESAQVL